MSDDPLDIPPFLRREKNPKTAPALRHATEHEWIMTLALARRRRASPSPGNRRAARSARARSALRETDTAGPRTARRSAPHAKARGAVTPRGETSLTRYNNPLRASLGTRASRRLRPSAWPGNEPPRLSRRLHLVRRGSCYGKTFDTLSGGGSRAGCSAGFRASGRAWCC